MSFKLDDILSKKKEPVQILDLSRSKAHSKEEFDKLYARVPEYKIKPEKVRSEDILIHDTDFSFGSVINKREPPPEYGFANPVPVSMRLVKLEDLSAVDINWRMLTLARPKARIDEDIFSRLVQLDKLRIQSSRKAGGPQSGKHIGHSAGIIIKSSKSVKGGIPETRAKVCRECGMEFCTGSMCKEYHYDAYARKLVDKEDMEQQEESALEVEGKEMNKGPHGRDKLPKIKRKKKGRLKGKTRKQKADNKAAVK